MVVAGPLPPRRPADEVRSTRPLAAWGISKVTVPRNLLALGGLPQLDGGAYAPQELRGVPITPAVLHLGMERVGRQVLPTLVVGRRSCHDLPVPRSGCGGVVAGVGGPLEAVHPQADACPCNLVLRRTGLRPLGGRRWSRGGARRCGSLCGACRRLALLGPTGSVNQNWGPECLIPLSSEAWGIWQPLPPYGDSLMVRSHTSKNWSTIFNAP